MSVPTRLEFRFSPRGKILASFDLHYGDFVIKDFRVMESSNGGDPWVGLPSRRVGQGEEAKWFHTTWIPERARKEAFERFVVREYFRQLAEHDAAGAASDAA
ncbi:MAG: hypothetical protein ACYTGX_03160 [Planctomycetota bacterium]|jgi:DNA-binding cell septation regulator SpoVG